MDNLLKEFNYRKGIALKGEDYEITGRLFGLIEWMESIKLTASLLKKLRDEGGRRLLQSALVSNEEIQERRHNPLPPDARSIEQVASVGLALLEEAKSRLEDRDEISISQMAWDYGIRQGSRKNGEDFIGKYVIPFLDYIEQRIPVPDRSKRSSEGAASPPAIIHDSLKRFQKTHRDPSSTCFVMMRFGKTSGHSRLEKTIKKSLKKHGFIGLLARDKQFNDDLYPNIQTYIHGCAFGIAVFERLESDEFNPNVALEVGYMFGLRKHVLLLKDQTLKALHTDLVGKLYREFDPQNPEETIPAQVDAWLSDKGLA